MADNPITNREGSVVETYAQVNVLPNPVVNRFGSVVETYAQVNVLPNPITNRFGSALETFEQEGTVFILDPMVIEFKLAVNVSGIEGITSETTCGQRDVLFMLDRSTSMNAVYGAGPGTRLDAAKSAIINVLTALQMHSSRAGLVWYSAYFNDGFGLEGTAAFFENPPGLSDDWTALTTAINGVSAGGYGTDTGDALAYTQTLMESFGDAGAQHVIIILSDGEWNIGLNPITVAQSLVAVHPDWKLYVVDINSGTPNASSIAIGGVGDGWISADNATELTTALETILVDCAGDTCINFRARFARKASGSDTSCGAYGGVTNLTLCSPIAAGGYWVEANVADLNGALPGDKVQLKITRVWNDPLNLSLSDASLEHVAIEYDVT